ncbi:hypothetical protein [Paracoccus salsus]|uniref:hypothetical protein n=1 Tax=Paracoccus salsus TaxID=2911061 RepID=UPI001F484053|nr:hypothetical protein [Paracoccus salsus]MCF3973806.1 hypothetical protein [Paracoccus salsus]
MDRGYPSVRVWRDSSTFAQFQGGFAGAFGIEADGGVEAGDESFNSGCSEGLPMTCSDVVAVFNPHHADFLPMIGGESVARPGPP